MQKKKIIKDFKHKLIYLCKKLIHFVFNTMFYICGFKLINNNYRLFILNINTNNFSLLKKII